MQEIISLQDAERFAAEHGYTLSPADRAAIADRQRAELARLRSLQPETARSFTQRFNVWYPGFLQSLAGIGEVLLTFTQTVIIAFGVPVGLLVLLVVEHQRVVHGIALFEVDQALASFAAFALVFLNVVLEFQVHYIEHRAGYVPDRDRRWSLRLAAQNWSYRLGLGENWTEQELSPAQRYRRLLRLVTFSILALALAGSMKTVIEATPGTWYEALRAIIAESSLSQMMIWAGGLLFAAAAVLGAQVLSRYVAIRCTEILANMQAVNATPEQQYSTDLDRVAADYILAKVTAAQARKAAKNPTQPPAQPLQMSLAGMSANGDGSAMAEYPGRN